MEKIKTQSVVTTLMLGNVQIIITNIGCTNSVAIRKYDVPPSTVGSYISLNKDEVMSLLNLIPELSTLVKYQPER